MPSIVALDLETTGLDPRTDSIIEIGAIRFNNRRIEEEFETLINPQRGIPEFITRLTGISNPMVQNSPTIEEVLPELVDFFPRGGGLDQLPPGTEKSPDFLLVVQLDVRVETVDREHRLCGFRASVLRRFRILDGHVGGGDDIL